MKISSLFKMMSLSLLLLVPAYSYAQSNSDDNPIAQVVNVVKDGVVTTQVLAKTAMDRTVSDEKVDVLTHNGTVILKGEVNSEVEKNRLIEIASSTFGTKTVDASQLTVKKSDQPLVDTEITTKIKAKFIKEKLFGDKPVSVIGINVETTNGIVYLTGTAGNDREVSNAIELAKSVPGVRRVVSLVKVVAVR